MSADADDQSEFSGLRLQRFLAQCGLGSRRECEELIESGRVAVDGEIVTRQGTTVKPAEQQVTLDGERLKLERKKYYILNKPPGYLCTARDPQGRRTIFELFPPDGPRLFCVGRLDENTTGLLIVTNDGDLSQKLAHPRFRIHRLYKAQVAGHPDREVFQQLRNGLFFQEGRFKVHDIRPTKKQGQSTWVEITMTEGQNREIRRLLARTGHKVMKLERIGFGPIRLGRVPLGQYRELRRDELASLLAVLDRNRRAPHKSAKDESDREQRRSRGNVAAKSGRPSKSGKSSPRKNVSAKRKKPTRPKRGKGRR